MPPSDLFALCVFIVLLDCPSPEDVRNGDTWLRFARLPSIESVMYIPNWIFADDCELECPLGRAIDEKGRELCECAEPDRPKCPSMIRCQKNCVYGYKVRHCRGISWETTVIFVRQQTVHHLHLRSLTCGVKMMIH